MVLAIMVTEGWRRFLAPLLRYGYVFFLLKFSKPLDLSVFQLVFMRWASMLFEIVGQFL